VTARVARLGAWLERHALVALPLLVLGVGAIFGLTARPVRDGTLHAVAPDRWPLLPALALALVALLLAALATPALRRRAWLLVVAGGLALAALPIAGELSRLAALEAASLVAFVLIYLTQTGRRAGWTYLLAVALSAALLVAGIVTIDSGPAGLVLALLLAGFALKLAIVPTYLWAPTVAERTPAAVVGLVLAVVDVAAMAELIALRRGAPWLFHPAWPWLVLGLLTAVGAAGLAVAQSDVKRLLAFAAVADFGYVLLGVALGGRFGLSGATLTISVEAVAAALLFSAVAGAERDGPVTLRSRGLARHHPLAAAGFAAGALAALGVPPTAGYPGHWRLYYTAYTGSPAYLAALIVATALLVLTFARVIAVCWWGGEDDVAPAADAPRSVWRSEPWPVVVAIVSLIVVVLAAGLWPRVL
jgi:formate hydrogenlyase subunit 3/multisubunit Na+/H+ antiporter MnhD subunit